MGCDGNLFCQVAIKRKVQPSLSGLRFLGREQPLGSPSLVPVPMSDVVPSCELFTEDNFNTLPRLFSCSSRRVAGENYPAIPRKRNPVVLICISLISSESQHLLLCW